MPRALYEAIWELERSEAAVEIFGQDVVDHYLNAAEGRAGDLRLDGPPVGPRALPRTGLAAGVDDLTEPQPRDALRVIRVPGRDQIAIRRHREVLDIH